jgi:hypothetical protein
MLIEERRQRIHTSIYLDLTVETDRAALILPRPILHTVNLNDTTIITRHPDAQRFMFWYLNEACVMHHEQIITAVTQTILLRVKGDIDERNDLISTLLIHTV